MYTLAIVLAVVVGLIIVGFIIHNVCEETVSIVNIFDRIEKAKEQKNFYKQVVLYRKIINSPYYRKDAHYCCYHCGMIKQGLSYAREYHEYLNEKEKKFNLEIIESLEKLSR